MAARGEASFIAGAPLIRSSLLDQAGPKPRDSGLSVIWLDCTFFLTLAWLSLDATVHFVQERTGSSAATTDVPLWGQELSVRYSTVRTVHCVSKRVLLRLTIVPCEWCPCTIAVCHVRVSLFRPSAVEVDYVDAGWLRLSLAVVPEEAQDFGLVLVHELYNGMACLVVHDGLL